MPPVSWSTRKNRVPCSYQPAATMPLLSVNQCAEHPAHCAAGLPSTQVPLSGRKTSSGCGGAPLSKLAIDHVDSAPAALHVGLMLDSLVEISSSPGRMTGRSLVTETLRGLGVTVLVVTMSPGARGCHCVAWV